jgi:hypothetical protein
MSRFDLKKVLNFIYEWWIILILSVCAIFIFFIIINNLSWPIGWWLSLPLNKSDFINACVAFGTIASAAGLVYFGKTTYESQKISEFYSLFPYLMEQHDLMLKECFDSREGKNNLVKIYDFLICNFPNINEENIDFESRINECVEKIFQIAKFKAYFLILYRLIKYIHNYEISDKSVYTGMIRAKIPFPVLFLVVLQSCKMQNDEQETYEHYRMLLDEYCFLEHLPTIHSINWTNDIFLPSKANTNKIKNFFDNISYLIPKESGKKIYKKNNIKEYLSGNVWGDNIYRKRQ